LLDNQYNERDTVGEPPGGGSSSDDGGTIFDAGNSI